MKPFLYELAEKIYAVHHRNLDGLTVVFPNRRATLYFRKHLSALLTKPAFAPRLITIEDFIGDFSSLIVPDKLELIHRLHAVYNQISHEEGAESKVSAESFDQFYFWGDMLLRDFDELDKYLIHAEHLFKDLSNQKEIDSAFDFLTDEQREFLRNFWLSFDEKDSLNKRKFLQIWRQLPRVYSAFRATLKAEGIAYEGMLHREVAENLDGVYTNRYADRANQAEPKVLFVGFNALTRAEEKIICYFVEKGIATLHWDVDAYYMHHTAQEAGKFFREYQQHPVLGKSFLEDVPSNFKSLKKIHVYGAAQPMGQAKLMAHLLGGKIKEGMVAEETLVVLPDEKLLMPVLHGISSCVDKLNVTMGFPLSSTSLFNLVELLVELQINGSTECFNHREVLALLGHPYIVAADAGVAQAKRKEILHQNWVKVPVGFLNNTVELHRHIYEPLSDKSDSSISIITYLKNIIMAIGRLRTIAPFDKEYCLYFIKVLNRMEQVMVAGPSVKTNLPEVDKKTDGRTANAHREALKSFLRLFRQLIRAEKIPFSGEPLRGLQVMGVLETRNLDFKNVFILSMNEGAFPSFSSKGSYVPFNIRKAYGLPTVEHQDAMYAYLFYRVLQRAESVHLFHNAETDELGQGEMSRYLQQLIYESGIPIEHHVLDTTLQPHEILPIAVAKDERVYHALTRFAPGNHAMKALSPSALNDYLECRLRFYFKFVAHLREADQVEEDLDARVLGNFLHKVMELFYRKITVEKESKTIEASDIARYEKNIEHLIDEVFIENYSLDPTKKVVYEGQRLVVKEIVLRFIHRIIEMDKQYAPFEIEALERNDIRYTVKLDIEGSPSVVLGGSIDRADRKGNVIRIIDYKTGKDLLSFANVPSLFNRDKKRNKAAFQTLLYTLLFSKSLGGEDHVRLKPGLLNRLNLFNDDFIFGLQQGNAFVEDATPLIPEFENLLKDLLEEMYNPAIPFDQTKDTDTCQYCSYKRLCYR